MTMQPYRYGSIEQRKKNVRKYSRNVAILGGVGIGSVVCASIVGSSALVLLALIAFVAAGVNYSKVRKIVNYKDPTD